MKKKLLVRFTNEYVYRDIIEIDTKKIKTPMVFPNEVFFNIDDVRIAIKREDWDELQKTNIEK